MLEDTADILHLPQRRNVRLDTLLRLRWLAIIGQTIAVLVVNYAVEFPLPVWADASRSRPSMAGGIACSWIGVGRAKPSSRIPFSKSACSPSRANGIRSLWHTSGDPPTHQRCWRATQTCAAVPYHPKPKWVVWRGKSRSADTAKCQRERSRAMGPSRSHGDPMAFARGT